eukprot:TRINITY_DN31494_c0_g1_i1.p1 TRINITY_DN31494_c0_g1~~TRINITY_DN31494_c0_g1_i1.p1  ORF type:complete len:182 (+),score=22.99 TRINITY_DN31494_c0_g1_i1:38-547(+)
MKRAIRALARPAQRGLTFRSGGSNMQQSRSYYWWDSYDSTEEFKAKLEFVLRSEGVENPAATVDRLYQSRKVHSMRDFVQHSLSSLKYYIKPNHLIPRVYRRIQRDIGSEISIGGKQGGDRDNASEATDGTLSQHGAMLGQKGCVDPRILRYRGPSPSNFKQSTDPDVW